MRRYVLSLALAAVLVGAAAAHGSAKARGVPTGFRPEAAAASGTSDLWVLGDYRCGKAWCLALVRSTDAGRRFRRVALPPLPAQGTDASVVFANARDGFSFVSGETPLYATRDGGKSWYRAGPAGESVQAFALGGGYGYAVLGRQHFVRLLVGRNEWRTLLLPFPVTAGPVSLAARGSHVWVMGTEPSRKPLAHSQLARSDDRGRTFATVPSPCVPGLGGSLAPAPGGTIWATCSSGMEGAAFRSTNYGRSFGRLQTPPLINAARVAPSSGRDAVLARQVKAPLLRTTNGGRTWRRVREPGRVFGNSSIVFSTHRVGVAVVQVGDSGIADAVWRTTDGGAIWYDVPLR